MSAEWPRSSNATTVVMAFSREGKCILQSAPNVVLTRKYRSSLDKIDPYIAANATTKTS
jgi:hypothetical protein